MSTTLPPASPKGIGKWDLRTSTTADNSAMPMAGKRQFQAGVHIQREGLAEAECLELQTLIAHFATSPSARQQLATKIRALHPADPANALDDIATACERGDLGIWRLNLLLDRNEAGRLTGILELFAWQEVDSLHFSDIATFVLSKKHTVGKNHLKTLFAKHDPARRIIDVF